MLEAALKEILRELAAAAKAERVALVPSGAGATVDDPGAGPVRRDVPLGGKAVLRIEGGEAPGEIGLPQLLDQAARSVRACLRRYQADEPPALSWPDPATAPRDRVLARIRTYLRALLSCQGMRNAVVLHHGAVVTSAEPLADRHRARLAFTTRRVDAEAARADGTSHADIVDDDCYATSFYYDAHVVAFFDAPYSADFVRHRVRLVTRELAELLGMLEPDPGDPADSAPRP